MGWLKRFFRYWLLPLGIVGLLILWLYNWDKVADWWRLRGYDPPPTVAALASDDLLSPLGKHLFYINHPELVASGFAQDCEIPEQTIVLGCYHSPEAGIFLFNVTDPRLQGVQQVTAAHEMLHAAYDRLSPEEKDSVGTMLNDYFNHSLHDQRIIDTINSYKKTEPNDLTNEMHSVFGTEVPNLPTKLENYYKKYFSQRSKVVAFATSYENEFTSRTAKADQYNTQLQALKSKIDAEESNLNSQLDKVNADRANLDQLRNSGDISRYNAAVPGFNNEVDSYNSGVEQLKSDINTYNGLVDAYNQVAKELRSLYTSIDTRLQTQSAQ